MLSSRSTSHFLRVLVWSTYLSQVPPLLTLMCTINGTAACGPGRSVSVSTGAKAEAVSHLQQATWLQASFDAAHIQ